MSICIWKQWTLRIFGGLSYLVNIMWSILMFTYYRLYKMEENDQESRFGERFNEYKELVPVFIPSGKKSVELKMKNHNQTLCDPVCGKKITRNKVHAVIKYEGYDVYLCCPLCQTEFESNPKKYLKI